MDKRKTDILSVLLIAIISIFFFSVFIKDDFSAYRLLRHERYFLKDAIKRYTNVVETHKNKIRDIVILENYLKEQKLFLLKEDKVAYFLNYVSSHADRNKVEIIFVEPGEIEQYDLFAKTLFTAEFRGRFPNVYNFIYRIEDDWRGVKVEKLSINKDSGDNKVNVRLKLSVISIEKYIEKT